MHPIYFNPIADGGGDVESFPWTLNLGGVGQTNTQSTLATINYLSFSRLPAIPFLSSKLIYRMGPKLRAAVVPRISRVAPDSPGRGLGQLWVRDRPELS